MTYIYIIFPSHSYSTKFVERDYDIFVKYNPTASIGDIQNLVIFMDLFHVTSSLLENSY